MFSKGNNLLTEKQCLYFFNPIALRKTKIVCNFGLSECNIGLRVDPTDRDAQIKIELFPLKVKFIPLLQIYNNKLPFTKWHFGRLW